MLYIYAVIQRPNGMGAIPPGSCEWWEEDGYTLVIYTFELIDEKVSEYELELLLALDTDRQVLPMSDIKEVELQKRLEFSKTYETIEDLYEKGYIDELAKEGAMRYLAVKIAKWIWKHRRKS